MSFCFSLPPKSIPSQGMFAPSSTPGINIVALRGLFLINHRGRCLKYLFQILCFTFDVLFSSSVFKRSSEGGIFFSASFSKLEGTRPCFALLLFEKGIYCRCKRFLFLSLITVFDTSTILFKKPCCRPMFFFLPLC